jgi:Cellulose binding domain
VREWLDFPMEVDNGALDERWDGVVVLDESLRAMARENRLSLWRSDPERVDQGDGTAALLLELRCVAHAHPDGRFRWSAFAGTQVTLPAESVVVLTTGTGSPPPTTTTAAPPPTTTTTAPSTTTITVPPTTTTAAAGSGCAASWTLASSWAGGFQLNFTVTNAGTTPTAGWQVGFTWPGTQTVTQIWNATETQAAATVTSTNVSFDGAIPPAGTTTFGLLGSGAAPTALTNVTCRPQ